MEPNIEKANNQINDIKTYGARRWVATVQTKNTCPKCGKLIYPGDRNAHGCQK